MTEREKFEAWATAEHLHLAMEEGKYMSGVTRLAHRTWQASRKQMAKEAAAVCAQIGEHEEDMGRSKEAILLTIVHDAIRSLATPTEGKT